jgi:hypothetical protein
MAIEDRAALSSAADENLKVPCSSLQNCLRFFTELPMLFFTELLI